MIVGFGAYTDLGWDPNETYSWSSYVASLPPTSPRPAQPLFQVPHPAGWHRSHSFTPGFPAVYCTWSFHYENDGIDQDYGTTDDVVPSPTWRWIADQGTNGLDDDGINGVDDPRERETSPPYDTPLRGVKISLRIYERDARQIRETSVTHSFK